MALYAGTTKVVADDCALGFSHFEKPAGTIESTRVTVPALDPNDSATYSGIAVAAGYGKIVTGTSQVEPFTTDQGAIEIMDLDGSNKLVITPNVPVDNQDFGRTVALHSKYVCVGTTNTVGEKVYIFNHDGTGEIILSNPDSPSSSAFGYQIAVVHNKLVVGAYRADIGGTTRAGKAYIYDLSAANIAASVITIENPNRVQNGYFGGSVAGGCGRIVVSAANNEDSQYGIVSGCAYVYDLHGNFIKKIDNPQPTYTGTGFAGVGGRVSVGSGRILVSANLAEQWDPFTGQAIPFASSNVGRVYMYDLDGNYLGNYSAIHSPVQSTNGYFGQSVAVNEGIVAIGAVGEGPASQGKTHIYDLGGNFIETLEAPNQGNAGSFGTAVAIGSGRIVVGDTAVDSGLQTDTGETYIYTFEQNFNTMIDQTGEGYV